MIIMDIGLILVVGVIVEGLVEYGKLVFNKTINWKQVAAIVVGIGMAFLMQANLFATLGITMVWEPAGIILTGIFASRGSNYLSDFIKLIQSTIQGIAAKQEDSNEGE